jgi:hypothetical protein
VQERGSPNGEPGLAAQRLQEAREGGLRVRCVAERVDPGKIFDIGRAESARRLVDPNAALEVKVRGPLRETGNRDMIAETVPTIGSAGV